MQLTVHMKCETAADPGMIQTCMHLLAVDFRVHDS